jgi:FkbM family methyltransferase
MRNRLNLWVAAILMMLHRRSVRAGIKLLFHVNRAGAIVTKPRNSFGGITLRIDGKDLSLRGFRTSDYEVFYQIFSMLEYEALCKFLFQFEGNPGQFVFIDCGANIGLASAYFHKKNPSAILLGIEPSAENARMASVNASYSRLFNKALTSEGGQRARLLSLNNETLEWAFRTEIDESGEIETIGLEELLNESESWKGHSLILKVDIEGAEFDVFQNTKSEVIQRFDFLVIEIHEFVATDFDLVDYICSLGYVCFPMGEYWFFRRNS